MEESNYLLDDWSGTTEGTGYIWSALTSFGVWPRGDYKVVWYVDGKEKLSVPFRVE